MEAAGMRHAVESSEGEGNLVFFHSGFKMTQGITIINSRTMSAQTGKTRPGILP